MTAPKGEPTPKRPSLARKHTPKTEANRKAPYEEGVKITFEGVEYAVRAGDLTALDAQALRKELGVSFMGLMRGLNEDPDIDLIAGLIWLAKRLNGDILPYAMVAADIGYNAMEGLDIEQVSTPEQVDNNPEG